MQNFIASSMRRFGLAPKNDDKLRNAPSTGGTDQGHRGPLGHMEIGSKWSYSTLEYPIDIQLRSDLGHYMMFYVNVPNQTSYSTHGNRKKYKGTRGSVASGAGNRSAAQNRSSSEGRIKFSAEESLIRSNSGTAKSDASGRFNTDGSTFFPGQSNRVIERKSHQGTANTQTGLPPRTTRTSESIILNMPPAIVANYTAQYKESELGGVAGEILGEIGASGRSGNIGELLNSNAALKGIPGVAKIIQTELEKKMGQTVGALIGSDPVGIANKLSNQAFNNFLEVMFTGVGFRKFSFTWKLAPKSVAEIEMVDKIIRTFKFHMMPEIPETRHGRFYVVPSEFDLFYMFRGDENTWMNKINTCVLVNMDLNYAPNQYQTYRPIDGKPGAPPTEIDLKLDFMETKLMSKADVLEGY